MTNDKDIKQTNIEVVIEVTTTGETKKKKKNQYKWFFRWMFAFVFSLLATFILLAVYIFTARTSTIGTCLGTAIIADVTTLIGFLATVPCPIEGGYDPVTMG